MAAVTTLPAASVITTLSSSQGALNSVQQPTVQVTATTGSTLITTMMGPPGPPGPSAASDGIFRKDLTVTGAAYPGLNLQSTAPAGSGGGSLAFVDSVGNFFGSLEASEGYIDLSAAVSVNINSDEEINLICNEGIVYQGLAQGDVTHQIDAKAGYDSRIEFMQDYSTVSTLGVFDRSFTEYGPNAAAVSTNNDRRTILDASTDLILNTTASKKIMLGVNGGSIVVVSTSGAVVKGTLDATGAIKQNGKQVFHAGNLSFGSGLNYDASSGVLAANGGSGSSLYQRPYRPGSWYPVNVGSIGNGAPAGADTLLWTPFVITQQVTVDSLLTRITTASSTGSIRIYLYAAGPNYWAYGAPLAATATLSAAVSQIVQGDVTPVTLTPGFYWFAYHASDGTVAVANGAHLEAANIMGHDDPTRTLPANGQAPWGFRSNGFSFAAGPPTITTAPNYYSGTGINRLPTGFFRVAAQ